MNTREKILVSASVIAFIWGAMTVMSSKDKNTVSMRSDDEDLSQFIVQVSEKIKHDPSQGLDTYRFIRARGAWGDDPFLSSGSLFSGSDGGLIYKGYVKSKGRIYALINNEEFAPGDDIDGNGLILRRITPDHVILVVKGKKKRVLTLKGDL